MRQDVAHHVTIGPYPGKNANPTVVSFRVVAGVFHSCPGAFQKDPVLSIATKLEQAALSDDYFVQRKLFPNVDFYSGIILEAMGFPTSMFTPIFAVSRTVGWISQWKEQISDPQLKIGRPRQLYLGETARDYTDIENR